MNWPDNESVGALNIFMVVMLVCIITLLIATISILLCILLCIRPRLLRPRNHTVHALSAKFAPFTLASPPLADAATLEYRLPPSVFDPKRFSDPRRNKYDVSKYIAPPTNDNVYDVTTNFYRYEAPPPPLPPSSNRLPTVTVVEATTGSESTDSLAKSRCGTCSEESGRGDEGDEEARGLLVDSAPETNDEGEAEGGVAQRIGGVPCVPNMLSPSALIDAINKRKSW